MSFSKIIIWLEIMWQIHRFYIQDFKKSKNYQLTDKDVIHQCNKVLRLWTGDFVYFFDWENYADYKYKLQSKHDTSIEFIFTEEIQKKESLQKIVLYQAISNKLTKLEYIVQKCSEVWVNEVVFFAWMYTQTTKFLTEKKIERLKKIAIEAAEQSNRNSILQLVFEKKLDFSKIKKQNLICFNTEKNNSINLKDIKIEKEKNISIFVWPEWWFHDDEIKELWNQDAQFVYLWENILRTETVWVVTSFFITHNL